MGELREIFVALPDTKGDIYRRHQLVWRAMHAQAHTGRDFLFAQVSDHLVCVRSACLERGTPSPLREGRLRVDLVTTLRDGSRMRTVPDETLTAWVEALLAEHGLGVDRIRVLRSDVARGSKVEPTSGAVLSIALPFRELEFEARIVHRGKAALAWERGIGRGKRFGFGMLRSA